MMVVDVVCTGCGSCHSCQTVQIVVRYSSGIVLKSASCRRSLET
jgi:coenzyme F420-reducing hydrogenase beta subunit